jgi:hypothetical protein
VFTHEQQANIRAWDDKKFSTPARLLPIKSNMQAQISQIAHLSDFGNAIGENLRVVRLSQGAVFRRDSVDLPPTGNHQWLQ